MTHLKKKKKKSICGSYTQNINAEFLGADTHFGFATCLII